MAVRTLARTLHYYAVIARSYGVPEIWLDDAAADIWLCCWRRGNHGGGTVRSAAIDAARRYGPRSRRGVRRDAISLEHWGGACACGGGPAALS